MALALRVLACLALALGALATVQLHRLSQEVDEAWRTLGLRLSRRQGVAARLVETATHCAGSRTSSLGMLTDALASAKAASDDSDRARGEQTLTVAVRQVLGEVKADSNIAGTVSVLALEADLGDAEDASAVACGAYNEAVARYNATITGSSVRVLAAALRLAPRAHFGIG